MMAGDERQRLGLVRRQSQPRLQMLDIARFVQQQRGQAEHRIGRAAERGFDFYQAGQQMRIEVQVKRFQDAVDGERGRRVDRAGGGQHPEKFRANALAGEIGEAGTLGDTGVEAGGIGFPAAVFGIKAEEAQDAQVVLADSLVGVADEAHAACREVRIPAERVVHGAVGGAIERVHREVATHGVLASSRW